jgi:hypothetical protein
MSVRIYFFKTSTHNIVNPIMLYLFHNAVNYVMMALIFIRCIRVLPASLAITLVFTSHYNFQMMMVSKKDVYFKEKEMIMLDILPCCCLFLLKVKKK